MASSTIVPIQELGGGSGAGDGLIVETNADVTGGGGGDEDDEGDEEMIGIADSQKEDVAGNGTGTARPASPRLPSFSPTPPDGRTCIGVRTDENPQLLQFVGKVLRETSRCLWIAMMGAYLIASREAKGNNMLRPQDF
mmetsp:Transcript_31701/g.69599  ORF Transcript_31701/g.69599 Transcript_31701/m.69599 type:complete len:138 (-) Transcript_31701:86-499(-)